MDIDTEIFSRLKSINWLKQCGMHINAASIELNIAWCRTPTEAVQMMKSAEWADVKIQAQGDMTEYLCMHNANEYNYWNKLADAAKAKVREEILPFINQSMFEIYDYKTFENIKFNVEYDIGMIILFYSYRRINRNLPNFFNQLFRVYENGYLPCGWDGSLDNWPAGRIIAY